MTASENDDEQTPPTLDEVFEKEWKSPFVLMADACLRAAVPTADIRQALSTREIVVLAIPSAQWLPFVTKSARAIWPHGRVLPIESPKTTDGLDYLKMHVGGIPLVVVSHDPDNAVPRPLLNAASKRYTVAVPNKGIFLAVAKKIVIGNVERAFADVEMTGLDFLTMCACLVKGDTAKQAAAKVRNAQKNLTSRTMSAALPTLAQTSGYGEAAQWAADLVADIADFKSGQLEWSDVDHGALLFGAPGTGKSLFARIVAKEAGVPIVHTSIADYFATGSGHLDGVIRKQREAFAEANARAPCILFIDELDALPSRNTAGRNADFWQPIITDLLMLLDSAVSRMEGVVVVGATNRIQDLDPALVRPGRMDRLLHVPPPSANDLVSILRFYLRGELENEDLLPLALSQSSATGADVVAWLKGARRKARLQHRKMVRDDLSEQILGFERRAVDDLRRIAVHEVGHVVAACALGVPVASATIADRGTTQGAASFEIDPRRVVTKSEIEILVVVMLAGRAAEMVMLGGEPSSGAGGSSDSDLAQATTQVRAMHSTLGMGNRLIYTSAPPDPDLQAVIEGDLRRLHSLALDLMTTHLNVAWAMVEALMAKTTIAGDELAEMFSKRLPGSPSSTDRD